MVIDQTCLGKKLVSVSEDMTMIVWDPKSAVAEVRLSGEDARFHSEPITAVAVNKDSTLAITGSMDGKARLVNILSGHVRTKHGRQNLTDMSAC